MQKWNYEKIKNFVNSKSKSILLTEYSSDIHSNTILRFKCLCGQIYEKPFAKFKAYNSTFLCLDCGKKIKIERTAKTQTITQEEFEIVVKEKSEDTILVLGDYCGARNRILVQCKLCNKKWSPFALSLQSGNRCQCNIQIQGKKKRMKMSEFIRKANELNPQIEVIGKLITTMKKIKIRCRNCDFEFERIAGSLIHQKSFCPKCHEMRIQNKMTNEDFKLKIEKISPNIQILEEYKSYHEKIQCRCKNCNHIWWANPKNLIQGSNCKPCGQLRTGNILRKSDSQFKKEVFDLVGDEYIILGTYESKSNKILMKHNNCGHIYENTPNSFLRGNRCPLCKQSKGEKAIKEFLIKNKIKFKIQKRFNDCRDVEPLPFDFYLPDNNICIEYDGHQHFKPVGFGSKNELKIVKGFIIVLIHEEIKNNYCKENNIELIRIPYWEKDNISTILTKKFHSPAPSQN